MKKKRILIVLTGAMELGGIERSLLGFLDAIDYDRYQVDLFLYAHHGPLFSLINKKVNLLPEVKELAYLRESFSAKLKHGCYYSAVLRIRDALFSRIIPINNDKTWAQVMRKCAPLLETEYDLAIGFFRPFDFIMEKVRAKKRVGWIHTDYSSIDIDIETLRRDYSRLDKIVAVSEECKKSFCTVLPELAEKIVIIENILSSNFIRLQASEDAFGMEDCDAVKLLTVGRYCEAKRQDEIPEICKNIVLSGINVRWFLIGFGTMEKLIQQKIAEYGMEKHVIVLGKKDNPYPYMKACDVYVQPSRYEGKCVAVREAQILHKPVVITNYVTSMSQLENGYDGVIVPMDIESCANGVVAFLSDDKQRKIVEQNTWTRDYTNIGEIEKVYALMSEDSFED